MKPDTEEAPGFRVEDRRHWMRDLEKTEDEAGAERPLGAVAEQARRAEEAEAKLQEYIAAYKQHEREQEEFRLRITADVGRRVEARFRELLDGLLDTLDHLDLALAHAAGLEGAGVRSLVDGVAMARDGFLATLEQQGVRRLVPDGESFDPHLAAAVRVDPVASPEGDGKVTATLSPGYALGGLVIRPARVAVGKYADSGPAQSAAAER